MIFRFWGISFCVWVCGCGCGHFCVVLRLIDKKYKLLVSVSQAEYGVLLGLVMHKSYLFCFKGSLGSVCKVKFLFLV